MRLSRSRWSPALALVIVGLVPLLGCGVDPLNVDVRQPDAPNATSPTPTDPAGTTEGSPTAGVAPAVDAGTFVLSGRFDTRDPAGPKCAWPGCRVSLEFQGTSVSARLGETATKQGPSEWEIFVDGVDEGRLALLEGDRVYDLATNLAPSAHRVELFKQSGAESGVTQVLGFDLHGGTALRASLHESRRIQVIGDADASGHGFLGAGRCDDGDLARWQSFAAAWPSRLGRKLDASVIGTVATGASFAPTVADLRFDAIWSRTDPADATSVFDLKTAPAPDAIVIAVGERGQDGTTTESVDAFLATVRAAHPTAYLALVVSPRLTDRDGSGNGNNGGNHGHGGHGWGGNNGGWGHNRPTGERTRVQKVFQDVVEARRAAGDGRITLVAPAQATAGELIACDDFGGDGYHERVAENVAASLRALTGW